jgi:hypothetical protein
MTAKQFTKLLQFSFRESYNENKEIISKLKDSLLKCKQENYLLKNKDLDLDKSQINDVPNVQNYLNYTQFKSKNIANSFANIDQYIKMKQNYELNMEFLINLVKLKIIGKNFQLDENVETIIETLKQFLEQIKYFFLFDYNKTFENNEQQTTDISQTQQLLSQQSKADSGISMSYASSSSSYFESTLNETNESLKQKEKRNDDEIRFFYSFPYDSLVHALQIFLNIFQIEWLYYLRSNLLDLLNDFIDELVKFVLECVELSQVSQVN